MLDRRGHAHLTSRLAAVVAMAGTVCLVVSGTSVRDGGAERRRVGGCAVFAEAS
jgi:hypothetical protein